MTQPQHIRHVVVLMMENRSFDHFLGWLPGADGKQAGLAYLDANGASHPTHELAPDFQGCGQSDPDHSYAGGRQEVDGGQMDGWLRAGQNDLYAIGYYGAPDLPFWGQATKSWLTFDRYLELALYDEQQGFYSRSGSVGRGGDFLTSPEVGPLFGAVMARALDQ